MDINTIEPVPIVRPNMELIAALVNGYQDIAKYMVLTKVSLFSKVNSEFMTILVFFNVLVLTLKYTVITSITMRSYQFD